MEVLIGTFATLQKFCGTNIMTELISHDNMVIYQLHITLNNIFNYCSKYFPNHKTITLSKAAMLHYYFWGSLQDPEVN